MRRALDRLEDLATERYGRGTAVSADREIGGWAARVWDARGKEILATRTLPTKIEAVVELQGLLKDRESKGDTVQ